MKKSIFAGMLFFLSIFTILADDLANILQDLAVQTACLGMYSKAETGVNVTSRYIDPPDWYTPPMMANRFAAMSGNMTRIETFYGVCFDYAQFAWNDINKYQKMYNDAGMKGTQWYIAITNVGNPNTIILYDPVSRERATTISNGIYLKENSRYNVYAHNGTSDHAWLWVQHNNGTWYWIDPTWTDNTGYVWWGIVENGREVQRYPNPGYCVTNNYPRPDGSNTGTRSSGSIYNPANSSYLSLGLSYSNDLPIGLTIADSMFFDRSLIYITVNCNYEFNQFEWICGVSIAATNWLRIPVGIGANHTANHTLNKIRNSTNAGYAYYYEEGVSSWKHNLVIEIGLQPVIFDNYYFSINYRLTGFSKSSLVVGAGIIF